MVSIHQQALFDLPASAVDDNCEWYTPAHIIEVARPCMGGIDLDPASCEEANRIVKATTFYTKEQDGLVRPWSGNVWLNPPYGRKIIDGFVGRLYSEIESGNVVQAMSLTNSATETAWWQTLAGLARWICFPEFRIQFWGPLQGDNGNSRPQTLFYCGNSGRDDVIYGQLSRLGFTARGGR